MLSPGVEIVISSEPDVDVCEVQSAEQDAALVEDQDRVVRFSNKTDNGLADKLTVGAGVVGTVVPPPPPPPPPPHEARIIIEAKVTTIFFIFFLKI